MPLSPHLPLCTWTPRAITKDDGISVGAQVSVLGLRKTTTLLPPGVKSTEQDMLKLSMQTKLKIIEGL